MYIERIQLQLTLTQLREMFQAGQSAKPAQEHHENGRASKICQANLMSVFILEPERLQWLSGHIWLVFRLPDMFVGESQRGG